MNWLLASCLRALLRISTNIEQEQLWGAEHHTSLSKYIQSVFFTTLQAVTAYPFADRDAKCKGAALLQVIQSKSTFDYLIRAADGNLSGYEGQVVLGTVSLDDFSLPSVIDKPDIVGGPISSFSHSPLPHQHLSTIAGSPIDYLENWLPQKALFVECLFHETVLGYLYLHFDWNNPDTDFNWAPEQETTLRLLADAIGLVLRNEQRLNLGKEENHGY